jgi:hypothetical protein
VVLTLCGFDSRASHHTHTHTHAHKGQSTGLSHSIHHIRDHIPRAPVLFVPTITELLFAVVMLLSTFRLVLTQGILSSLTEIAATWRQPTFVANAVEPRNLTGLLSTDAISADVVVLHEIKNNTVSFVNAARQFYTKYYSVENFRTQDLAIGDGVMADINSVREFLSNITSHNSNIDSSFIGLQFQGVCRRRSQRTIIVSEFVRQCALGRISSYQALRFSHLLG